MKNIFVGIFILIFVSSPLFFVSAQEVPVEGLIDDPVAQTDTETETTEDPIEEPVEEPVEEPIVEPVVEPIVEPVYVYLSEIAWMGTAASTNDEWIELYNPNVFSVDLSGWHIYNPDLSFDIALAGTVQPLGYFLLERTDETTVSDITADQIYTGALKNDGESLSLIDSSGVVIDSVDLWYAGDNDSKATMARADFNLAGTDPLAWCTSDTTLVNGLDASGALIIGTPGQANNCTCPTEDPIEDPVEDPVVNNPPVPVIKIQGDSAYMHVNVTGEESSDPDGDSLIYFWDYGDGTTNAEENPKSYYYDIPGAKTITLTVTDEMGLSASTTTIFNAAEKTITVGGGASYSEPEPIITPVSYTKGAVTIDSVLPNPDGDDSGAEEINFKNNTSNPIDLIGWKIADLKGSKTFSGNLVIPALSTLEVAQDVFDVSLNNGEETIYLYDPAGNLMDEMSWSDAASGVWIPNLSFLYDGISATVTYVTDGDTIKVLVGSREMSVRLIGVDTPETVDPHESVQFYGQQASDYLNSLISGKTVTLAFDENKTDVYGRLLAYVYLGDLFVNEEIIRQGYGYAYTNYPFKFLDEFVSVEAQAKKDGAGMWADPEIAELIENPADEIVDSPIDGLIEGLVEGPVEGLIDDSVNCISSDLKIDSILPNPQKGQEVEFIRLINTGSETVCLNGWSLDDVIEGGSKPFELTGGSIAPGAMRTFRKDETGIALNNSDDCATLIGPDGSVADEICYGTTHKNEIFTHEGGNWITKKKTSIPQTSKKTVSRDALFIQHEFKTETALGNIEFIYDEGALMYMKLADDSVIQISYAGSSVDVSMAKQLLDISQPVEVSYLAGGDLNQLISIDQALQETTAKKSTKPYYLFILMPTLGVLLWIGKKCRSSSFFAVLVLFTIIFSSLVFG